jgi:hypothetical protein
VTDRYPATGMEHEELRMQLFEAHNCIIDDGIEVDPKPQETREIGLRTMVS